MMETGKLLKYLLLDNDQLDTHNTWDKCWGLDGLLYLLSIVLIIDFVNCYVLYSTFSCEVSVLYTLLLDHMRVHHADDYM